MLDEKYRSMGENQAIKAMDEYNGKLFSQFGGDNGSTPWEVSVVIDGMTGETLGEPVVAFPGEGNGRYLDRVR